MIEVEKITCCYDATVVLKDVTLSLPEGGVTAIIGPNGAGKSTLLSIIGRTLAARSGRVTLDGEVITKLPGNQVARRLAVLRQDNHMAARLSVHELVSFGRYPHCKGRPRAEDLAVVDRSMAYLGISDLSERFLDQLSGGQRQRAFIAMVLAQDTDYILLDEPLNNLDIRHAVAIMRLLRDAARDLGKTVVVVMHDINMASAYCDKIVVMKAGEVQCHGAPSEIMTAERLEDIYGTDIEVHEVGGRLVAIY